MWPPWRPSGRLPQQGGHAGCLRHPADRPYGKTGHFHLDGLLGPSHRQGGTAGAEKRRPFCFPPIVFWQTRTPMETAAAPVRPRLKLGRNVLALAAVSFLTDV